MNSNNLVNQQANRQNNNLVGASELRLVYAAGGGFRFLSPGQQDPGDYSGLDYHHNLNL